MVKLRENFYFQLIQFRGADVRSQFAGILPLFREDTHKKVGFLVVGPLRVWGGGNPPYTPTTKQKNTFFYKWRKFTGKLHNENINLTPAP